MARDTDNIVGSVLGKYRVISELSTGGMGEVYRAQHEILGKPVAVKLLRRELTENADLVTRFVNEAKAASAIQHPGIIEILDFGYTDDDRAYLVMEFLDGQSLAHRIKERGHLTEVEAAQIGRGIASALTAAHGKTIIHRDLKPDNVFLVADPDMPTGERPKVLDFGIAKLADRATGDSTPTRTGVLMGTPLYMAPEQAVAAGHIDHRADLYSLGCIIYEMLVGAPPFTGAGAGEIIAMQMFDTPQLPSKRAAALGASISPQFERIVMRLLEKEPEKRYQSASDVSAALASAFGPSNIQTSIPPPMGAMRPRTTSFGAANSTQMPLFVPTMDGSERPAPRSKLPIIAAAVTLAIAGIAVAIITRETKRSPQTEAAPPAKELVIQKDPPIRLAPPETVAKPPVQPVEKPPVTPVNNADKPVAETPGKRVKGRATPGSSLPTTEHGSPIELTP